MLRMLSKIRLSSRFSWGGVILVIFYLYLGYHALSGDQGLLKWADYNDRIVDLEQDIGVLKAERQALEFQAGQLRAAHLDLDRLDEEARRILNVSHTNEIVIWLDGDDEKSHRK